MWVLWVLWVGGRVGGVARLLAERVGAHEVAVEVADELDVLRHDHPRLLQLRQLQRVVEVQPNAQRHRACERATKGRRACREVTERTHHVHVLNLPNLPGWD